jgi:hypothetical protein
VDVVAAGPQLLERGRLVAELVLGPAGHSVERDVRDLLVVVDAVVPSARVISSGATLTYFDGNRPSNM